ncbi:MAG: AAA family ATPase, partial [Oscillospiraceae bacterium]|nr:AAA family ATPase [Oscillospiraceae bacterium]
MVVEPKESANSAEKSKLLNMESRLKKRIVGQDAAISSICRAIRRSRAGFKDPARPVGSFIFLGTSGIGKTELCKALAAVLYGSEKKLLKFDMSECMHAHDSSRLTGSAPGYVGYENGGQLTNAVKQNPSAVLCLDEIEKANPDVLNLFLQIMEDGVLTSGQGEKISFADILIIMTSNIGAEEIVRESKPIGFSDGYDEEADVKYKITDVMKNTFKPEFLNRIDEIIT